MFVPILSCWMQYLNQWLPTHISCNTLEVLLLILLTSLVPWVEFEIKLSGFERCLAAQYELATVAPTMGSRNKSNIIMILPQVFLSCWKTKRANLSSFLNYRGFCLPSCYQIFIQGLVWFPVADSSRLLLCRAAPRCKSRVPLYECDAWRCWKRTCMLSKSLPPDRGTELNKATTTGPRQRSPRLDWFWRRGPETPRAPSKQIQRTSELDMDDWRGPRGRFSCERFTSCEPQGHNLNPRVKPAPSIQLCHCPWWYHKTVAVWHLPGFECMRSVIFLERESLWWPLVAACRVDSGSWMPEVACHVSSRVAVVEQEADASWSTVWKSKEAVLGFIELCISWGYLLFKWTQFTHTCLLRLETSTVSQNAFWQRSESEHNLLLSIKAGRLGV